MSVRFRFEWIDAPPSPDCLPCHTMAAFAIDRAWRPLVPRLGRRRLWPSLPE